MQKGRQGRAGRLVFLTVEQCHRLLAAAKADQAPYLWLLITIGLETAMRKMEILSIRKENIDIDRRLIYVHRAKAGPREQPITQHLAGVLAPLREGEGWLFPSTKSPTGHMTEVDRPFRRVVQAIGLDIDQVTRHTLRHTAISHLVQAGVGLPTVKRISGHASLQMVERYAHQSGEHISAAVDVLEGR